MVYYISVQNIKNTEKQNPDKAVLRKEYIYPVSYTHLYTDDLALKDCLIVKVLRSPHAHALIEEIDCKVASRVPGIECILTWKDVPQKRFTMAGRCV